MTREAKIGMLTGLGVIVLIGVLLSEYLGGPATPMSSTGRMANLPLGDAYRREVMQPVGVPGAVRNDAGAVSPVGPVAAVGQTSASVDPVLVPSLNDMPKAYASMETRDGAAIEGGMNLNQPVIGQPVAAVPAGSLQPTGAFDPKVATLDLGDKTQGQNAIYVAGQSAPTTTSNLVVQNNAAPQGDTYVIVSGDSLPKIAKKFYKSAKNSDIHRIVAANPMVLKDEKTVLMIGKKLFIPSIVKSAAVVVTKSPAGVTPAVGPLVIAPPSAKAGKSAAAAKKDVPTVYVVQKGDTLGKIAHELFPGSAIVMTKKIMVANSMKNADDIHIGEKLKIPAKI